MDSTTWECRRACSDKAFPLPAFIPCEFLFGFVDSHLGQPCVTPGLSLSPSLSFSLLLILQNGGAGYDSVEAMVMDQKDGSVILAGAVDAGVTDYDFSITKLDTDGLLLWEYEVR